MLFQVVRTDVDATLAELSARQHGVFSRLQALQSGATDDLIRRRLKAGRWSREQAGVYAWPGAVDDYRHRLWIAHLAIGTHSVTSHEASAALRHLLGFPEGPLVFTVPHSGFHRIPDTTVHQITDLTPGSCVDLEGLPATNVARTIADLAGVTRVGRLAAALDDAVVTKRLTTFTAVGTEVSAIARRGKRGLGTLIALLDARGPGESVPQSKLEQALFELLEAFGLPKPKRQFRHPGRVFTNGCVDAAYPGPKLVIEADGRRWHTRIRDLARDHHRDAEATRAGWDTLRLLYEDIVDQPEWTAELVAETLAMRSRQLHLTSTL
jgi:very-short-patch-repair endonuclease